MIDAFASYPPSVWAVGIVVAMLAGFVKGVVGFALPMILVLGLGAFLPPETIVAGLILPTLFTNAAQALRRGPAQAFRAARQFRVFLVMGGLAMILAAQLVLAVPQKLYFLMIAVPICLFVLIQLIGWSPQRFSPSKPLEAGIGLVAGFMGGLSGIWGPPTVAYLTALGTDKPVQMQVQGVIYGLGALLLTLAHWGSGVLNQHTVGLSVGLTVPALIGMAAGTVIQDRIDQTMFRRATLLVLLIAGLNLLRRGLVG